MSVLCPECENVLVVDVDAVEEGDSMECEECGSELEITSLEPLKVVLVDAAVYDDPEELSFTDEDE
jgi:alpha-aminoadipate carrier protein LysW